MKKKEKIIRIDNEFFVIISEPIILERHKYCKFYKVYNITKKEKDIICENDMGDNFFIEAGFKDFEQYILNNS